MAGGWAASGWTAPGWAAPSRAVVIGAVMLVLAVMPPSAFARELVFTDIDIPLQELSERTLRDGWPVDRRDVAAVQPGISNQAVLDRLGTPDEARRPGGRPEWDYNLRIPFARSDDVLVCQFKVVFDRNRVVTSTHWRRFLCETAFESLADAGKAHEVLTLSADVLFEFDSAALVSEGRERLRAIASALRADYDKPLITLVGHTDRIGPPEYNRELSQQRAESVRTFLAQEGLDQQFMVAEGRGESEPVVSCPGSTVDARLKACLQPNRRVEIQVVERGSRSIASR